VWKRKDDVRQNQNQNSQNGRRNDRSARSSSGAGSASVSSKTIAPDAVCWLYNLPKGCFWGSTVFDVMSREFDLFSVEVKEVLFF
jgi:hypothetical protein